MANHGKEAAIASARLSKAMPTEPICNWAKQASTMLHSQKSETKLLREDIVGVSQDSSS